MRAPARGDNMEKNKLTRDAEEVLKIAEQKGVQTNFFFATTFKRYQVQMNALAELESQIKKDGTLVSKQYVKGRENLYLSPAVEGYNKTANAANQTVATLLNIIKSLKDEEDNKGKTMAEIMEELTKDE